MSYLDEIKTRYDIKDYVEPTILKSLGQVKPLTLSPCSTVIDFSTAQRGEELLLPVDYEAYRPGFVHPIHLSNGEYHRFEMAMSLDQGISTIDEFTSVLLIVTLPKVLR
jgi:hypothetical protein